MKERLVAACSITNRKVFPIYVLWRRTKIKGNHLIYLFQLDTFLSAFAVFNGVYSHKIIINLRIFCQLNNFACSVICEIIV